MIDKFNGDYEFLSNFYECPITYKGITYRNAEAAYQAQKCPERAHEFSNLTGAEAKKLGREVPLRNWWEQLKVYEMKNILEEKFQQNPELKQKLIDTKTMFIEEGNWWGDTFWGVCTNKKYNHEGENQLGKILMQKRYTYQIKIGITDYKPKEYWEYYIDEELAKEIKIMEEEEYSKYSYIK